MFRALVVLLLVVGCATTAPAPDLLGQTVAFTAPLVEPSGSSSRAELRLESLRGKVVLVDLWASWCVPCKASFSYFDTLRTRLANRDFEVVAISVDEDPALAAAFLSQHPVAFPVVWDEAQRIVQRYPIKAMPTSLVLDRNGVVRHVHGGFDADAESALEEAIESALSQPAR